MTKYWPCGCDYCNGVPSEAELAAAQLADHGDMCDCYECHEARTTLDGMLSTPGQKPRRLKNALRGVLFFAIAAVVVWLWFHALFGAA